MDYREVEKQELKDWFKLFADRECKEVSPLYYSLSTKIAEDDELIHIASHCKQRQPMPNLFFASIQYLLFKDNDQELANYYPSITKDYKQDLPFELFNPSCNSSPQLEKKC